MDIVQETINYDVAIEMVAKLRSEAIRKKHSATTEEERQKYIQEWKELRADIAGRFFHPAETAYLRSLPASASEKAFFDLWCLKESFIKMNGLMDRPLRDMVFLPAGDVFEGPDGTAGRVWSLPDGYTAALVCRDPAVLPAAVRCPFSPENTG